MSEICRWNEQLHQVHTVKMEGINEILCFLGDSQCISSFFLRFGNKRDFEKIADVKWFLAILKNWTDVADDSIFALKRKSVAICA